MSNNNNGQNWQNKYGNETLRYQRPENAQEVAHQPRHRRGDRYKQQSGDAPQPQTVAYVNEQHEEVYQPAPAKTAWIERRTEDGTEMTFDAPARPARERTPVPPQQNPKKKLPLLPIIAALLVVAAAVFFLAGPFSPFGKDPDPVSNQPVVTAEVLEFKAPSAAGLTNTQMQLHLTTSPSVTGVKLTDAAGNDIPCTANSINADEETVRIWTLGVLFSQPFEGEIFAQIRENDTWIATQKSVYLSVSDAVPTQAPIATDVPTEIPTEVPTEIPTEVPTQVPTEVPTEAPTQAPTEVPTQVPVSIVMDEATVVPTEEPTPEPTEVPTQAPTQAPTEVPTPTPTPVPTPIPTEEPSPTPVPLTASCAENTAPDKLGLKETVFIGSDAQDDYTREEAVIAPHPDNYAYNNQTGVYTFRGDNFRRNAAFGTVEVTEGKMDVVWSYELGALRTDDSGTLYGVGWNNQPAIVKWTKEVREMMNLTEEAKATVGLREVIFSALDGNVYFLNLETGEETRAPIKIGYPMRGSVSVDSLGRPMIGFGQAISKLPNKTGAIGYHVYNLMDQSELMFINGRSSSEQKQYGSNGAFDGCGLFVYNDGKTTMLVSGENGLFYAVDMNCEFQFPTQSNPDAKANISINPETTYLRHLAKNQAEGRVTMESAVAMYNQYVFLADGYGIIRCVDTNTLQSVWAVDAGDNTDAAIALDDQDGTIALYTGNTAYNRLGTKKDVTIRRLDAMTGEEKWQYQIKCEQNKSEQSGVKASPVVGQNDLGGLVYFTVNMVDEGGSKLLALDKESGELVWEKHMKKNSVSSPVAVYNEAGNGWIIQCDAEGNVYLLDGLTGYENTVLNLGGKIEASPAVYRNMLVIGTCSKENHMMYGIQIH